MIVLAGIYYPEGYKILDSAPAQLAGCKAVEAGFCCSIADADERSRWLIAAS